MQYFISIITTLVIYGIIIGKVNSGRCFRYEYIINNLGLIVITDSFYVKIKEYEIFIRKEDFNYTLIMGKDKNQVSKELLDTFDFAGAFYEDEKYIYYNKIRNYGILNFD